MTCKEFLKILTEEDTSSSVIASSPSNSINTSSNFEGQVPENIISLKKADDN